MTLVLALAAALAACTGSDEAAKEKVERIIESQMSKDGGKAKVELSQGGFKATTTDASGKTGQVEMGTARVSEAELGVRFYPGTEPGEGQSSRISAPTGTSLTVMLHSDDAVAKVADFYRDELKAKSAGKQFMEMGGGSDGVVFSLSDDNSKFVTQVAISKAEKGTDVQIMANRGAP
jgi:hypothetical protein